MQWPMVSSYSSVWSAALAYAQALGPEKCKTAHLAPPFRKNVELLMGEAEARRLAAEEGLELITSTTSRTGLLNVNQQVHGNTVSYHCSKVLGGKMVHVAYGYSKWEVALAYARYLGPAKCKDLQATMSEEEAERTARAEGLTLLRDARFASGFIGRFRFNSLLTKLFLGGHAPHRLLQMEKLKLAYYFLKLSLFVSLLRLQWQIRWRGCTQLIAGIMRTHTLVCHDFVASIWSRVIVFESKS